MSIVLVGSSSGSITLQEPAVAGTTTLNLPATSGTVVVTGTTPTLNGITFPATQVPSADANTLDDYEEGTYTPVPVSSSGSITSYTSLGRYTKIGNLVSVMFQVLITNTGTASGILKVTLPFAPNYSSITQQPSGAVRESYASGNMFFCYISTNTNELIATNSTGGGITWNNNWGYTTQISYFV